MLVSKRSFFMDMKTVCERMTIHNQITNVHGIILISICHLPDNKPLLTVAEAATQVFICMQLRVQSRQSSELLSTH